MADETWKTQPPYQKPDEASSRGAAFEKRIQGACHCERVRFWLNKDKPLASKYCHCDDCKIMHGAPFQWAAIFQKSDLAFEKGVEHLRFYNASSRSVSHELPCKVSCSHCGTLIMDEGKNMVLLFPTLLSFKDELQRLNFDVQCHIFYPRRVIDISDGKPKWEGLDEKSQLLHEV